MLKPFSPMHSYQFEPADYDQRQRTEKLKEILKHESNPETEIDPLWFTISSFPAKLSEDVIADEILPGLYRINDTYKELLARLRLHISIPYTWYDGHTTILQFIAEPELFNLEYGDLDFLHFYPMDFGPPAIPFEEDDVFPSDWERGVCMSLPDNGIKLGQIQCQFILFPPIKEKDTAVEDGRDTDQ